MECLNNKQFFASVFCVLLSVVLLQSCYYDNKEELLQNIDGAACDTTNITYNAKIGAILDNSCALSGCHNSTTNQSGYDFSQYSTVKVAVDNGRLAAVLSSGSMPKSPGTITACNKQTVLKWVNNGAPEN